MRPRPETDTVERYDRCASSLARRFDSVSFEQVHNELLDQFPSPPARILDVGAGSGRDANALERMGYDVTAVEPAAGLRRIGKARTGDVKWVDDRLPSLSRLHRQANHFDFILCSAVLMSIAPSELAPSIASMASLLRQEGRLSVSVREQAPDNADVFYSHSDEDILGAANAAGLSCVKQTIASDAIGRGFLWRSFVFTRS
jgi:SAM-dependent methyltransferase